MLGQVRSPDQTPQIWVLNFIYDSLTDFNLK